MGVGFIGWLDEAGRTTGEAAELGAVSESDTMAEAVAIQMSRHRGDRCIHDRNRGHAGRERAAD
jgi:hypothetical protein